METESARNLFRYPLGLTPEASFIVRRHEPLYTVLIPLWLKARDLLPRDAVVHGIVPSDTQMAVALVCETPSVLEWDWKPPVRDITRDEIPCCPLSSLFPGAEEAMPVLSEYIKREPHRWYKESGPLTDVLDSHTLMWLMENSDAGV